MDVAKPKSQHGQSHEPGKEPGFDSELDRKHYYLAHETVVRREKESSLGPISFAIFSFLNKISSRAPDYFKIPHDGVIEVGFRIEI